MPKGTSLKSKGNKTKPQWGKKKREKKSGVGSADRDKGRSVKQCSGEESRGGIVGLTRWDPSQRNPGMLELMGFAAETKQVISFVSKSSQLTEGWDTDPLVSESFSISGSLLRLTD